MRMRRCALRWPFAFLFLIGCGLAISAWAVQGPILPHADVSDQREFKNVYDSINAVPNGVYKGSSMTLQGLTVDSITVNNQQSGATLGRLKQAVSTSDSSDSTATTDFSYSVLSANITPSSASSKILLLASGSLGISNVQSFSAQATIFRGSTNLGGSTFGMASVDATATASITQLRVPVGMVYLDSPSTTSAVTYSVRIKASGGGTASWNVSNSTGSLVAIEIL